eukprot:TRINITY_DN1736_c0_g1_i1.p1 TRINITY_DN1736_c0_g1~~TRINITY_DN1736_c0_g1_i1.p1  ORF type:complete len:137 (-),score=31.53 TRINITY_DN1736_c0_g1_i1:170-580(-)
MATTNQRSEKALQILGVKPSTVKLLGLLGLRTEQELVQAYNQVIEMSYNPRRASNRPMIDKRSASKACKLLGYDPSLEKVMKIFGFEFVQEAQEAVLQSVRIPVDCLLCPLFKEENAKAFRVLGLVPMSGTIGIYA